jgi:hypothetical protein
MFAHLRQEGTALPAGITYMPPVYPGLVMSSISACLHVWDEHGKVVYENAVPGMTQIDGVGIDSKDSIYIMSFASRMLEGRKYPNKRTGTLMKLRPGKNKFVSSSRRALVPLAEGAGPDRPHDLYGPGGPYWVDGAEWLYGAVGLCTMKEAGGCVCWSTSRFVLDYFARCFAPEIDLYSVAVLDTNGNLIMRIGQYGNEDDGMPLVAGGGSPAARPIGGDEVALFHPCYVATHTDRRLYIGDYANARIVQVKLDYHAEETIALADVVSSEEEEEE